MIIVCILIAVWLVVFAVLEHFDLFFDYTALVILMLVTGFPLLIVFGKLFFKFVESL